MTFCIITHVKHYKEQDKYFAYAPYVREMNIWLKYTNKVIIVAPLNKAEVSAIDITYEHHNIDFREVNDFSITNIKNLFRTLITIPKISIAIYRAMEQADHIHLRCPGNMGFLSCLVQILFPNKKKTAKYAGNWDPKANQPWSYRLQKWILSSTFVTKNMQVLVYGEWPCQTKNIKPFFTATYSEYEKKGVTICALDIQTQCIEWLYAGNLTEGKRPLYVVQLAEVLINKGVKVRLRIFGEGKLRNGLKAYIQDKGLQNSVILEGNRSKDELKQAMQQSHYLILPSRSEGWPKVVAESMFWGCVPVASAVSCVPDMLAHGERGILLTMDLSADTASLLSYLSNTKGYRDTAAKAMEWSRQYTIEKFESEIKKLLI